MKYKILIFKIINIHYNFYRFLINRTHQTLNINSIHFYANKFNNAYTMAYIMSSKYRVLFVRFYFLINLENILIITIRLNVCKT